MIHKEESQSVEYKLCWKDNNKLSVWNEGELLYPLNAEMLKKDHPSLLRNPLIANVFYRAGYIEAWGQGTTSIIKQLKTMGFRQPEFNESKGSFEIVFYRVTDKVTDKVTDNLSDNQKKIIELIKNSPHVSTREMAETIGISKRKILENISKLKKMGKIRRIGTPKDGHWEIIPMRYES